MSTPPVKPPGPEIHLACPDDGREEMDGLVPRALASAVEGLALPAVSVAAASPSRQSASALDKTTDTTDPAAPSVDPTGPTKAAPPKRKRYTFKNQGLRANKSLFLKPDCVSSFPSLSDSVYFDGIVTEVPFKSERQHYVIEWTIPPDLPADVYDGKLRTNLFKGDAAGILLLKAARDAYDESPGKPSARCSKGKKGGPIKSRHRRRPAERLLRPLTAILHRRVSLLFVLLRESSYR